MQPPDAIDGAGDATELRLPVIVIPCYNEEQRLDRLRLESLASSGRVRLLFVNDGSSDGTSGVLASLARSSRAVEILEIPHNVGKAEAVRRGLVHAAASGAPIIGYYDADLSTPPGELLRLLDVLDERAEVYFVMAARVALLGRTIERSATRHYLGRIFATMASLMLGLRVYDTQCGAKLFRVTPAVTAAIEKPFRSSWIFDVELIGRLARGTYSGEPLAVSAFQEIPLREWHHVPGSKLGGREMVRALADLLVVGFELNRKHRRR